MTDEKFPAVDALQGSSLLAAFFASAIFLLIVPSQRKSGPHEQAYAIQPSRTPEPPAAPVIGAPADWKR